MRSRSRVPESEPEDDVIVEVQPPPVEAPVPALAPEPQAPLVWVKAIEVEVPVETPTKVMEGPKVEPLFEIPKTVGRPKLDVLPEFDAERPVAASVKPKIVKTTPAKKSPAMKLTTVPQVETVQELRGELVQKVCPLRPLGRLLFGEKRQDQK